MNTLCSESNCSTAARTTTSSAPATSGTDWSSAFGWIVYMDFLYGYLYFLVLIAPVGLLLNVFSLVVILMTKSWSNPVKDHYLYNAGMNIFLSISFDVLVTVLRGVTIFLNKSGNLSANLQVDNLNSIICAGHNYVNPVLEFIWMWNAVNFSLKRCLIICFPFRATTISKLMNWRLMAAQVAIGCALSWPNLVYYRTLCFSITPTVSYCSCYNPAAVLGSWQILYNLVARQYLTFSATILILVASDVLLIVKLIAAAKNRRALFKGPGAGAQPASSAKSAVESRLTHNVILFTTIYLAIIVPYFLINTFLDQIYEISTPYLLYGLVNYLYFIGKASFAVLRCADFLMLVAMVPEFRKALYGLLTKKLL